MEIWPFGGAIEFEIETPNLLWLIMRASSNCVPNFIHFPQAVLGSHKLPKNNKKKTNRYNRWLRCLAPEYKSDKFQSKLYILIYHNKCLSVHSGSRL